MDRAALKPSKKRKKRVRSVLPKRHLPPEIIEEILLNLPQKSLLRFTAVSKSWNSMISKPVFARKHKNRAALLCRHSLVVYMNANSYGAAATFRSLAPISSDLIINRSRDGTGSFVSVLSDTKIDARDFIGQFKRNPYLRAFCDELWCVQVKKCLYFWNPSMRSIVKLPATNYGRDFGGGGYFIYGLAYDSVNDDYKILKIKRHPPFETELYSLKNKCWRKIEFEPFSSDVRPSFKQQRCEFVDGKFHWTVITSAGAPITIASFDLSTEKYGEVALLL